MGPVETIFGQIGTFSHDRLEGEDNASAVLRFKNGALGVIQASTSVLSAQPRRIEIQGANGSVIIDGDQLNIYKNGELVPTNHQDNKEEITAAGSSSPMGGFSIEPHKEQFENIVEAVFNHKPPVVSGEDSLYSLAIVLAIYESAKKNKPINIDEFLEEHKYRL